LLLLAATTCLAQDIIIGDPTEPCGPIRPDYWIGRHDNPIILRNVPCPASEESRITGKRQTVSRQTANADSYSFGSNVRVNDDPPGTSFKTPYSSGGHAIAARGDTVYLVWRSDCLGTSTIYFDKSTDSGNTWGTDVQITDSDSGAIMPALALGKDGTIYVSWTDFRHITRQIYFAKSTDGGSIFTPGVHVQSATPDKQQYSSIAVNDSGYIFIAYEDFRNLATTAIDIYCSRSTDGGNSFEPSVRVDDCPDSIAQWGPCVAAKDSNVYISWTDFRTQYINGSKIFFAKSINLGATFEPNVLVVDTVGMPIRVESNSSLVVDNSRIYVSWGYGHIRFTKSLNNGQTFVAPNIYLVDAAGSLYNQNYPSLTCDDSGGVYCAWEDRRNGSAYPWLIYFNYSKNYGDSFATNNIHVDDRSLSEEVQLGAPTICANKGGKVFCAWDDNRINHGGLLLDIYVTAGILTGIEGEPPNSFSHETTSLQLHPNPFRQQANIKYGVGTNSFIQLKIYNIAGQLVKTLDEGYKTAGNYKINWNQHQGFSTGVYFVCLHMGNKSITQKIIKIK